MFQKHNLLKSCIYPTYNYSLLLFSHLMKCFKTEEKCFPQLHEKLFIIPLDSIIGGEGKHVLLHPSKMANIFKYLDTTDLLCSLAHISTYKSSTRFATSQKITSMRMFLSVSFGSLAHGESLIINRFGVLPSFITMLHTAIYLSRLSQLYTYLWNSPKSAAEGVTPLCSNLHALGESTWKTWALFNLAKERLWGPYTTAFPHPGIYQG